MGTEYMGQEQSVQQTAGAINNFRPTKQISAETNKIPIKWSYKNVELTVPYEQLGMIKLLQSHYKYEVKGTLYFDHTHKFISFEIRTDVDPLFSTGGENWRLSFHTHPDKTAQKYGIRYYSPPSVDDVMEIYDHSMSFKPDTVNGNLGEISIVFTNEGIYVMQADREAFSKLNMSNKTETEQEEFLNVEFNTYITHYIKDKIRKIYELEEKGDPNFENPNITYSQFSRMISGMCKMMPEKFGFKMEFYDWHKLKDTGGLIMTTSSFNIKKMLANE